MLIFDGYDDKPRTSSDFINIFSSFLFSRNGCFHESKDNVKVGEWYIKPPGVNEIRYCYAMNGQRTGERIVNFVYISNG